MMQLFVQISLIAISAAGIFSVIQPMFDEIEKVQSETEEYDRALSSAREANSRLAELNRKVSGLSQQERHRIELLVPEVSDPVKTAYEVEQLIVSQGVFLNSINIAPPVKIASPVSSSVAALVSDDDDSTFSESVSSGGGHMMVGQDVLVSVSGTYSQFKELLTKIESSARLIDITSVSFQGVDSDINTYLLTLRTYGYSSREAVSVDSNN